MGKELTQTKGTNKYNEKARRMASPMASYEDRLKAVLSRKSQLEENRLSMARQRIIENALKHEKLLAERKKDLETRNQTNTSRIAAVLKRREQILMETHARKVEILRQVELKCIKAAEMKSKAAKGKVSKRKTSLSQAIFHQLELPVNKYKNKICTMPKAMPTPKRLVNTSKTVAPKSPVTMSPKRKIRSASGSRLQNQASSAAAALNEAQKSKTLGRPKKSQTSSVARDLHSKKDLPVVTASEATPKRKTSATKQEPPSHDKSSERNKEKDANSEIEFYKQKMAEHRRAMRDKMNANKAAQQPAKVKAPNSAADAVTPVGSPVPGLMAAVIKPETDQLDRSINDLLSIANTEVGRINTLPDANKTGLKIGTPGQEERPMSAVGLFGSKQSLAERISQGDKKVDVTGSDDKEAAATEKTDADTEVENKDKVQEDQNLKLFEKEEQMMIEQEKEKQKLEEEREKQRIEAQKIRLKEQEEFERLQEERRKAEEEERAERRARLEAIMKRTRSASVAKSSSPAPSKSEPKEAPVEQPKAHPEPVLPPQTQRDDSDQRNESEATAKSIAKEYSREHSVSPEPVMESAQAILTPTEEGVRSANLNMVQQNMAETSPGDNAAKDDTASRSSVLDDLDPLSSGTGGGTGFSGLEDSGISLAGDDLLSGLSQMSINTSSDDSSNSKILEGLDFSSASLLANNNTSATDFCAKQSPLPALQILSPVQENAGSFTQKSKGANDQLGLIDLEESPRSERGEKEVPEEGTSLRVSNEDSLSKSLDESSVEHAA